MNIGLSVIGRVLQTIFQVDIHNTYITNI